MNIIGGNSQTLLLRRLAIIALCAMLLLSFFLFVPAFNPGQQLKGEGYANSSDDKPVPVDSSYSLMLDWMDNQTELGTFRYQVIPTLFSTSIALGSTSSSSFAPLQSGLPETSQYAYYSIGALLSGQTQRWGLLLAPADIKYVVVIQNNTEPNFGLGATPWAAAGEPSLQSGPSLYGDYRYYAELLNAQSDMKLVVNESDFLIYENLDYLANVAVFPSLSYVVGDLSTINDLAMATNFSANSSMLVYSNQPLQYNPLLYADTVIFNDRNITDLALDNLSSDSGINLFNYGSSQRTAINYAWVQATPINNNLLAQGIPTSGLLSPTNTFIETTGESELNVNFSVSAKGAYDVWLNVLFSPQSTGNMTFFVDNEQLNSIVHHSSQTMEGFKWIELGTLNLSSGQYTITIKNSGGYAAVNYLQIVDPKVLEQEESVLSASMINKSIMYFLDDPSLFNVSINFSMTTISAQMSLPVAKNYSINCILSNAPLSPTLLIDGKPVPITIINDSSVYNSSVYLTPGYHNFTLTVKGANSPQFLAVNSENLGVTNGVPSIASVTTSSNTKYIVNVTSGKPFYLMLGESYDNNWHAYLNGQELPHFYAYSFQNGYYINVTGTISIIIKYNGQDYLAITWFGLGMLAFMLIYIIFDVVCLKRLTRIRTRLQFLHLHSGG
ncbi:MAG: hypothetical protein ABSB71_01385 [Candidatus Bathyarchaeia archaeon]